MDSPRSAAIRFGPLATGTQTCCLTMLCLPATLKARCALSAAWSCVLYLGLVFLIRI